MRRNVVIVVAVVIGPGVGRACRGRRRARASPRSRSRCARTGYYAGAVDGISGPQTRDALAALPAQARHPCDREGRHGDAVQARQARRAAPRPAAARERARRLGRHLARVPPPRLWASREARGRALRRGDHGGPGDDSSEPRAPTPTGSPARRPSARSCGRRVVQRRPPGGRRSCIACDRGRASARSRATTA